MYNFSTVTVGTSTPVTSGYVAGELFFDSLAKKMKVFTGKAWVPVGELTEEQMEDMLCDKHPGLKELREIRDQNPDSVEAQEKFAAYKALVQEQ